MRAGMNADAHAMRHRFLDHLQIVEVQRLIHFDAVLAQKTVDFAADGQVFIEADEIDAVQVGEADDAALGQRMIGRRGQHHLLLPPRDHCDFAARLGITHQAEIGFIGEHRRIDFFGPQIFHFKLRSGWRRENSFSSSTISLKPDRINGRDADGALDFLFDAVERDSEFFFAAQNVAAEIGIETGRPQ